jgi:hypothetical protein
MSNLLIDILNDKPVEIDAITQIGASQEMVIRTPLVDITLKTAHIGDVAVRGDRGLLPLNVINALADKIVVQIATIVRKLQVAIDGEDAFIDGTATPVFSMFAVADGIVVMHPEFEHKITGDKIAGFKLEFAEISACVESVLSMGLQRDAFFPHARDSIQFAWNATSSTPIMPVNKTPEALTAALTQAIAYRVHTGPNFRALQSNVASRRAGGKTISATGTMNAATLLQI